VGFVGAGVESPLFSADKSATHCCPQDLKAAKVFVIVLTDLSQVLELTLLRWLGTVRSFYVTSLSHCPAERDPPQANNMKPVLGTLMSATHVRKWGLLA
jgi:hypothetical protein